MTPAAERCDVLVVGGGPAGLAHAFWRQRAQPDLNVTVLEASSTAGGWVQTLVHGDYACEAGPQGIRPDATSDALVEALDLGESVVPADPAASRRFLARGGALHPVPSGPPGLLGTKLFSLSGKLRLFTEPFRRGAPDPEETLAAFIARRFGRQAVPFAEALASGVFGGDAHAIELAAAFPAIHAIETEHGSLIRGMIKRRKARSAGPKRPALHTFQGGMHTLVTRLSERIGTANIQLDAPVTRIEHRGEMWHAQCQDGRAYTARELILAVPAHAAATLCADTDADLATELRGIPFASIANVYLGFPRAAVAEQLSGFGFLVDRSEQTDILGVIYCSSVFPEAIGGDSFLVRAMVGGALHPDSLDRSDTDLVKAALQMLRSYAGVQAECTFQHVHRVRHAIPQFERGHAARVARIRAKVAHLDGLQLIGNSYDAISIVGQLGQPTTP